MRRPARSLLLTVIPAVLVAGTLLGTGPASQATPASGEVDKAEVGRARHPSDADVALQSGHDTVNYTATMGPGATSGWHRHPDALLVLVKAGTLTGYGLDGELCVGQDIPAGTAYFEDNAAKARYPHFVRNRGDVPVELVVVAFNVPPGGHPRFEADAPAECSDPTE